MTEMIDTLEAMKRFQGAGFPEPQANALVQVFRDMSRQSTANLATKDDLQRLEARFDNQFEHIRLETKALFTSTQHDIGNLRLETQGSIATAKNDIVRWMIGSQVLLIAALVALSNFTKVFG